MSESLMSFEERKMVIRDHIIRGIVAPFVLEKVAPRNHVGYVVERQNDIGVVIRDGGRDSWGVFFTGKFLKSDGHGLNGEVVLRMGGWNLDSTNTTFRPYSEYEPMYQKVLQKIKEDGL